MNGRVASNVIWNWAGMGVSMLAGFVLAPYLVHTLGDSVYGLWILIASMTGYFGLLDLGVRGSVGRYIAYYRARGEQSQVNAILSTAVAILSGVAVLALLATGCVLLVFFHLFDVPADQVAAARLAIVLVGVNFALTFPVSVFDGVLWGQERFDLINAIDIPTAVVRLGLTFWLVRGAGDIVTLAWITLGTTAANELIKLGASFHVDRRLRMSPWLFSRAQAAQLFGYGLWQFLLQIARQVSGQIGPLLIGGVVSVAAVTPFSIASRLLAYASQFAVAATGVLTPMATRLHARDDHVRERRLFVEGGRWCMAFALYASIMLIGFGGPLLRLWMGQKLAAISLPQLTVLTMGETLAISQWLTYSIILGKARHRAVAIASLVEGVVAGVGGFYAARFWGPMGICVVFAVAAFGCRGVFQIVQACRVLRVPVGDYIRGALVPPIAAAVLPALVLWATLWWRGPVTWVELFTYGSAFSVLYAGVAMVFLGGLQYLPRRWFAVVGQPAVERFHG